MLENSTWLFGMQAFFKKKWLSLKKGLNYYKIPSGDIDG
jgi:hypothetical protein